MNALPSWTDMGDFGSAPKSIGPTPNSFGLVFAKSSFIRSYKVLSFLHSTHSIVYLYGSILDSGRRLGGHKEANFLDMGDCVVWANAGSIHLHARNQKFYRVESFPLVHGCSCGLKPTCFTSRCIRSTSSVFQRVCSSCPRWHGTTQRMVAPTLAPSCKCIAGWLGRHHVNASRLDTGTFQSISGFWIRLYEFLSASF